MPADHFRHATVKKVEAEENDQKKHFFLNTIHICYIKFFISTTPSSPSRFSVGRFVAGSPGDTGVGELRLLTSQLNFFPVNQCGKHGDLLCPNDNLQIDFPGLLLPAAMKTCALSMAR